MPPGGSPIRHNFKRNRDGTFKHSMPAKRKRRSSYRRPYRRRYRRRGPSLKSLFQDIEKRGPGSANFTKYGPSRRQMSDLGVGRTMAQSRARFVDRYTGDGDYRKYLARGLGAAGGAVLGNFTGAGIGSGAQSGWDLGSQYSKYMGWGDYGAINNQIMGSASGASAASTPVMVNASDDLSGDIIVSNREFIGNITRAGRINNEAGEQINKFQLHQYSTNPGNAKTFPFLSNLAKNFELFELEGCIFQFIPLTTDSSDKGHSGKIIMATNYDMFVDDTVEGDALLTHQPFNSSTTMQNYDYATSAKPQVGQVHGVECAAEKRTNKKLFIDEFGGTSPVTATDPPSSRRLKSRDKNLTEYGTFCLATEGIDVGTTDQIVGELWVTYKCHLSRAKSK